jgi:hypothetical protein
MALGLDGPGEPLCGSFRQKRIDVRLDEDRADRVHV